MKIDPEKLEETIREVLAGMATTTPPAPQASTGAPPPPPAGDEPEGDGVFADMDTAIEAAYRAWRISSRRPGQVMTG